MKRGFRRHEPLAAFQILRDGAQDPLRRTITTGFAVVVTRRGAKQSWIDQIFQSREIASETASACCVERHEIKPARRITYMTGKPPKTLLSYRSTIIIDDRGPDAENS